MISNKLVMPEHLNPFGNLFGGTMMSWMDKIAAMEAADYTKRNCVTAKVSEINFNVPVKLGNRVMLDATVSRTGRTSIIIHVVAKKKHLLFDTFVVAASADFVFVALDDDGKPDPSWKSQSESNIVKDSIGEDMLSAKIGVDGSIISQTAPWIHDVKKGDKGVYNIKFIPGLFLKVKAIPIHSMEEIESYPSPEIATNKVEIKSKGVNTGRGFSLHAKLDKTSNKQGW